MDGEYPVFFAMEEVGRANVCKEGMFWRICCRCGLSQDVPCRLQANWGEETHDLGLFTKEGDGLGLTVRINRKSVPAGKPVFRVAVKHRENTEQFVPISSQEPFAYIARLKHAYLVNRAGQLGIAFRDHKERVSPTGQ